MRYVENFSQRGLKILIWPKFTGNAFAIILVTFLSLPALTCTLIENETLYFEKYLVVIETNSRQISFEARNTVDTANLRVVEYHVT